MTTERVPVEVRRRSDAERADYLQDALLRVQAVLATVDAGHFATSSRDFGRGAATVARLVRAALAGEN